MAKIKFGMMMVDARGKLGGQVFTKTRSGATVRTKVTPVNPQTPAQALARVLFAQISRAWRDLTENQREAWDSSANLDAKTNIFGDQYFPSGKNYHQSINANLLNVGRPLVTVPATPVAPPAVVITDATVTLSTSEMALEYDGTAPVGVYYIVYEATKQFSAGRKNYSGAYAKILVATGGTYPTDTDLYDAYVQKFGIPTAGMSIGIRVKTISSSGIASTYSSVRTIVEA